MDTRFAISQYPDAAKINNALDELIKKPVYTIEDEALKKYEEEYFEKKCAKSKAMISEAKQIIPGGVQHNLAFNYPFPLVFTKADGYKLYDIDGNEYYDFLQAGGPTVLGSNPACIREQVIDVLNTCGPSTGLFHEFEYKLAKKVADSIETVDMFRMLQSGTEACMVAARIARLATKNKNIVKMGGAYHGWSDQLGYGIRIPGTKFTQANGVPARIMRDTQEFFPGDLDSLERVLRLNLLRGGTAAVYLEPLGPESGSRPVDANFCKGVERLCRKYGALLVFDEVVTGFRVGMAGAQGYFGCSPDLTIFGKVIAGGYPGAGGVGGKKEYMKYLGAGLDGAVKVKKAFTGGTLSANPLSCAAGYFTLEEIDRTNACQKAGEMGDRITKGLQEIIAKRHLPFVAFNQGSICHMETVGTLQFAIDWSKPWTIPAVLKATDIRKKEMTHMGAAYMAEGIVTLAGSRLYTSAAYTEEAIDDALTRFDKVFSQIAVKE
ncbi:MAG: aminotransferase class III-fold pyridoxal phosphate-dependent enzyme [Clostridia bacterium]|nr:aminotransferase class III-fold pyridoxal phosphate-dependent enzyme [Clostridia bacterium]MBR3975169.1 aminotransferase class III-fold pyridoxal phosphate-dependent enzyme [Clostridia bacterium]